MSTFFNFAIKGEYRRIAQQGNNPGALFSLIDREWFRPLLSDLYTNIEGKGGLLSIGCEKERGHVPEGDDEEVAGVHRVELEPGVGMIPLEFLYNFWENGWHPSLLYGFYPILINEEEVCPI